MLQWASGAEFDHVNLLAVQTDCVVTRFPFFGLGRVSVLMTRHTLPLSEGFFWQQSVLLVVPPAAVHACLAALCAVLLVDEAGGAPPAPA